GDGWGNGVRGLRAEAWEVTEDGKPQEIRSFSFEEIKDRPAGIETADLLAGAKEKLAEEMRRAPSTSASARKPAPAGDEAPKPLTMQELAGRRLIVLLF